MFFGNQKGEKKRDNVNDERWRRDFGAPIQSHLVLLDPYLSDGTTTDKEKGKIIIEINSSRCPILNGLLPLPSFRFENIRNVTPVSYTHLTLPTKA